jgi:adenylylsulfate kinase
MSFCLWVTGLPGSGKSTIVKELEPMLSDIGIEVIVLSLDHLRKIITPEARYTDEERELVYRSLAATAHILTERAGKNVIIDATGNRKEFRALARKLIPEFAEVYVACPLEISKRREAFRRGQPVEKDLYQRAEEGTLKGNMPGVTAPYEEPEEAEVRVASDRLTPRQSAERIMNYVRRKWFS